MLTEAEESVSEDVFVRLCDLHENRNVSSWFSKIGESLQEARGVKNGGLTSGEC